MARVLLIDDDDNLREVVRFILTEAGHEVGEDLLLVGRAELVQAIGFFVFFHVYIVRWVLGYHRLFHCIYPPRVLPSTANPWPCSGPKCGIHYFRS